MDLNNEIATGDNNATVDLNSLQQEAVKKCYEWYEPDEQAKRFYVDEMKEMYKLYKGDHWDLIGPGGSVLRTAEQQKNRPNSVENVTFSLVEGTASEFAQDVELIDYPVEAGDDEAATKMTDLKKFLFYKNRHPSERIKFLRWFFLYGTGIWHLYWDPDWKGGKGPNRWIGDIRWDALHPMSLIPDARCKEDINEGNRCHKRIWHTLESVKERYPEAAAKLQEQTMEEDDLLDTAVMDDDGYSDGENRQNQIPVIETWYVGEPLIPDIDEETGELLPSQGPGMHVIWWAGESEQVYLRHENYMYCDPDETTQFPFIVSQCYQRENSIWGFGEAYFLKNPQIVRNKTAEIIMEGHLHHALGQTWYDDGALTSKQQKIVQEKGTLPGMWFAVKNGQGIHREYGKGVPGSLLTEMNRNQSVMETIIGRFDISQGRTPGNVTAFKAIAELSARAQVRLRNKEMTITQSYEEAGQYVNRLISRFYTERRQYRIIGKTKDAEGNDKHGYSYGVYKQEDMLKVWDKDMGTVTPFNQMPNPEGINPDTQEVYFPDFDTYCKTSSVQPSDRFYNIEIAKELLTLGAIDIAIFLKVMDTGKFPPMEEIQKLNEQKAMQMMQQQQQQQDMVMQQQGMTQGGDKQQQPPQQPAPGQETAPEEQQMLAFVQYLQEKRPDLLEAIKQLPEGERKPALLKLMQKAEQEQQGQQRAPQAQPRAQPMQQVEEPEPELPPEYKLFEEAVINLLPQDMQAYLESLPPEQKYYQVKSILQALEERGQLQDFLDEIQDYNPQLQDYLLRIKQQQQQ